MPPSEEDTADGIFRLLGPLELRPGGRAVPLGGMKARTLLVHLLFNANRLVPAERLIEVLWSGSAPASASANLQTYVWTLRKNLPPWPDGDRLVRHGGGYTLRVAEGETDIGLVDSLIAKAAAVRVSGDVRAALALYAEAAGYWRGEPVADLPPVPAWEPEIARLAETRLSLTEERLGARVRLGEHDAAAAELRVLLAAYPYRERLWELLMRALEQGGRRADALAAYADARDLLVSDLGVEPGEWLREAQLAILRGGQSDHAGTADPVAALDSTDLADGVAEPVHASPGQLPPDVPDFTGRAEQLARLLDLLRGKESAGAPPVAVVAGAPGAGKTALALRVAHLLRTEFADGQLYADLSGTAEPRDPVAVLGDFLHALGVTGAALPVGAQARESLFRSMVAGRRMLVLLDDAATAAQVRSLLPAGAGCAVLVTSRRLLPELPGAQQLELPAFGSAEARELLARIAGADRVAAEPEAAGAIVRACGYVPLAIRIAGARLAGRRAWTLGVLRDRLADGSRRLSELRIGDLGVRSSFELSVRQLGEPAVRLFGLLSLLGPQDFPGWAVEPLLGGTVDDAQEALDELVDANLVALAGTDVNDQPRYRVHDLLACYATEVLGNRVDDDSGAAALERTLACWTSLSTRAATALPVAFGAVVDDTGPGLPLSEPTAARLIADPLRWFAAERRSLLAAIDLAATVGLAGTAWRLAAACVPFHDLRGHYEDWQTGHERALSAVTASGDTLGAATLRRGLGQVHLYRDEYAEAARCMASAAMDYAKVGDRRGEGYARAGLGTTARVSGRPAEALGHYQEALLALISVDDRCGEAQLRSSVGVAHMQLGDAAAAADWLTGALALARELGDPHREAKVLTDLGSLHGAVGGTGRALDCLERALVILRELRDERCTAYALLGIARTLVGTDAPGAALGPANGALEVFRRTGNRHGQEQVQELLRRAEEVTPGATRRAADGCTGVAGEVDQLLLPGFQPR